MFEAHICKIRIKEDVIKGGKKSDTLILFLIKKPKSHTLSAYNSGQKLNGKAKLVQGAELIWNCL